MNILLLSYYAPPLNSITSFRAYTLAKYLGDKHKVILVSKYWDGTENTWEEMLSSNPNQKIKKEANFDIHFLPYKQLEFSNNPVIRKIKKYHNSIRNIIANDIDTLQFSTYCDQIIQEKNIDLIFATAPPYNILSLANLLSMRHNCFFIADFRDLLNNIILKKDRAFSLSNQIELFFTKRYLKKHLSNANLINTASEPFTDYLKLYGFNNVETVLNGFESEVFENIESKTNQTFEVTLIGTLYPEQNLDYLIGGFTKFIQEKSSDKIRINFIGVGTIPEVSKTIVESLDNEFIKVTSKIPREEALQIAKKSQVLFYAGWDKYVGIYSGKIFEYLGLRKNILIAPGDQDVIDKLILKTNSGKIANSALEVSNVLNEWYDEWEENKQLRYHGTSIENYSRKKQYEPILKFITSLE